MQLKRLQKESSVRVIAYELNLAQTTPSVRISAHRNGDSNYNEGVVVIGNSINQVMANKGILVITCNCYLSVGSFTLPRYVWMMGRGFQGLNKTYIKKHNFEHILTVPDLAKNAKNRILASN